MASETDTPELGIIEGYFGPPWSWEERRRVMELMAPHGYRFFIYAPKDDAKLRRDWREPFDDSEMSALADFSAACRAAGVRFGVGLSPFEVYLDFNPAEQQALADKLKALDSLGIEDLGLLFDDMQGDVPDLARREIEVAHFVADRTAASRIIVCPTYYSDDPVLDRVFGRRPHGYLEQLGAGLDPSIQLFWTGEEVCARQFSVGHLDRVTDQMQRRPFLWDNYPVNDGPIMSQYLHLRAFTGRPAEMAGAVAAHGVNPALQPTLSCIPMVSLALSYQRGRAYDYGAAFLEAAEAVAGPETAAMLQRDLLSFQDRGLDRLQDRVAAITERYGALAGPAAQEVVRWLEGGYMPGAETAETQ